MFTSISYYICATIICVASYVFVMVFKGKRKSITMAQELFQTTLFDFSSGNKLEYFPLVYNHNYDISFSYLERLHPFDTHKWSKVHKYLVHHFKERNTAFNTISPLRAISNQELALIHSKAFISSIHNSKTFISRATEVFLLRFLPMGYLQSNLINPVKWQTAGSILAADQALEHGWAINLGGGFHHASRSSAEGFCLIADITLIIKYLWKNLDENMKFMIVDLDAHQGNGYESDKFTFPPNDNQKVFIFDMYNKAIYPRDKMAKYMINKKVEINSWDPKDDYMKLLKRCFNGIFKEFRPDLVIYNAGTDVLEGDPLGKLHLIEEDVIKRDEYVFTQCKNNGIPIVMLTSGGYQRNNAQIIAKSIINLIDKRIIERFKTSKI